MRVKSKESWYKGELREKRSKLEDLSHKVTASLLKRRGMGTENKIKIFRKYIKYQTPNEQKPVSLLMRKYKNQIYTRKINGIGFPD